MRKYIYIIFAFTLIVGCCSNDSIDNKLNDDFYSDFSSENNRIAGELYLDVFDENLENLTYDYYIKYLAENETPSAEGLTETIKSADKHYFKTKSHAFLITLYYKPARTIICDNSGTAFLDSVQTYKQDEEIPSLEDFTEKIKF